MSDTEIADWSEVPSENTTVAGINIDEGAATAQMNDALRSIMAGVAKSNFGADPVEADVLNESTVDAGVTVDGLLIKDGRIESIQDTPSDYTAPQRSPFIEITDGAIDFDVVQNLRIVPAVAGALTITFLNEADGQSGEITIDNRLGTATSVIWPGNANFGTVGAPIIGAERAKLSYSIENDPVSGFLVDIARVL